MPLKNPDFLELADSKTILTRVLGRSRFPAKKAAKHQACGRALGRFYELTQEALELSAEARSLAAEGESITGIGIDISYRYMQASEALGVAARFAISQEALKRVVRAQVSLVNIVKIDKTMDDITLERKQWNSKFYPAAVMSGAYYMGLRLGAKSRKSLAKAVETARALCALEASMFTERQSIKN